MKMGYQCPLRASVRPTKALSVESRVAPCACREGLEATGAPYPLPVKSGYPRRCDRRTLRAAALSSPPYLKDKPPAPPGDPGRGCLVTLRARRATRVLFRGTGNSIVLFILFCPITAKSFRRFSRMRPGRKVIRGCGRNAAEEGQRNRVHTPSPGTRAGSCELRFLPNPP